MYTPDHRAATKVTIRLEISLCLEVLQSAEFCLRLRASISHLTYCGPLWTEEQMQGVGGLSSGEISLFSSMYPLDRCAMIKNGGKICQMVVPCLIIKGAPVPETVGSNLKTWALIQHFLSTLVLTLQLYI